VKVDDTIEYLRFKWLVHGKIAGAPHLLVHCFAGIGRTGTVLAAWLLQQDPSLSAAQAIARVRDEYVPEYARTRFPEHSSQAEALEQFAKTRQETQSWPPRGGVQQS
jgi:protein-tyrosine phosphatase